MSTRQERGAVVQALRVRSGNTLADVLVLGPPDEIVLAALAESGLDAASPWTGVTDCADTRGSVAVGKSGASAECLLNAADVAGRSAEVPLVMLDPCLRASPAALLDVLDPARDVTAAGVVEQPEPASVGSALVRLGSASRRVVSSGSARHTVTNPTASAAGVLRVAAADRAVAAGAWHVAASSRAAQDNDLDPFDLTLLTLVRAGVMVTGVPLTHFDVERAGLRQVGATGGPWRQRLRASSRGNDGVFSVAVVRPVSRHVTDFGLRHGWTPNAVTLASLALGLIACALTATGDRWAWMCAAVLLMGSLVLDCVDGEIARFTRSYSPLGAWLDGVSDRIKEFAMIWAVAWVATRQGQDLWWFAILLLAVLAARHVEDFAYTNRLVAQNGPSLPDRLSVDSPRDLGPSGSRTSLPASPSRRSRIIDGIKQVIHLPIAERYLIMAICLVAFIPALFIWALGIASLLAFGWTQVGRLSRAALRRDGFRGSEDPALPYLCDLGMLPRPSGTDRFMWQLPVLILAPEVAALMWLVWTRDGGHPAAYVWLAVVCWHSYDVVYRVRETGEGSAHWLSRVVGVEVRLAVLVLLVVFVKPVGALLALAAGALLLLYAAESAHGWSTHLRARRSVSSPPSPTPGQDGGP